MPATAASPREVARYLIELRPIIVQATHQRQELLRRVGLLFDDVRTSSPHLVARQAGQVGREQLAGFRHTRTRLEGLMPPPPCRSCHGAAEGWLDKLLASCELLIEVGVTGCLDRITETQAILADGRTHARRFNTAQAELIADVRARCRRAA